MNKILVVDDNRDILEVLEAILKADGIDMIGLTDTKRLYENLVDKPCMILLDVHISKEDGRDVCRKLKADPKTKDIPVVMFSASSSQSLKLDCQPDEFVEKPFDINHLVKVIKKYCKPSVLNQVNSVPANNSNLELQARVLRP